MNPRLASAAVARPIALASLASIVAFAGLAACASAGARRTAERTQTASTGGSVATLVTPALTRLWPAVSRDAAAGLEMKYGPPDETTSSMLVWREAGPFKRIAVHAEGVRHALPTLHEDVVEHVIEYRVPVGRIDEVLQFNGSLEVRRTAGELASRCANEALNVLALNLAHDIVVERRSVAQARREFSRLAVSYSGGGSSPYTDSLAFRIPAAATADPDRPVDPSAPDIPTRSGRP